mgnify:CR=1 FL=1
MLVIKNGTLISMAGIYKEKYDVAVENGKIAKLKKRSSQGRRTRSSTPQESW